MMRCTYDILEEPRGDLYRNLIDFCGQNAEEIQFIIRHPEWISAQVVDFMKTFQNLLIVKEDAGQWPGTKLIDHTATLFRYRLTPELLFYIKFSVEGLYDWEGPDHFEDICFLRADGSVLLGSIVHEKDSFMELSVMEHEELAISLPVLITREQEEDECDS